MVTFATLWAGVFWIAAPLARAQPADPSCSPMRMARTLEVEKVATSDADGLSASLIASGIIMPVLSTLVGRERPTEEQGAYSFHPFDGRSFPSGHATQAFAVASVIATSYDQLWVKVVAYGAASVLPFVDDTTFGANASLDF